MCMCVAVPTDDGRNSYVCLTELEPPNQHAHYFLPRTTRQSLSCVLIPFPCVLPGSRVEFCQWCPLVRCSPLCLTCLFVPFAPLLHFGVTGFLLSPMPTDREARCREMTITKLRRECTLEADAGSRTTARRSGGSCGN